MFNKWLKPYLPRSLFGRAFLILIVPIVLIQVVVAIVFVERLFQDVTRQMTQSVAIDVNHLISVIKAGDDPSIPANSLQIATKFVEKGTDALDGRRRDLYDFSGPFVIETLRAAVPETRVVDLGRERGFAVIQAEIDGQMVEFQVARSRLSASNPHQVFVYMVLMTLLMSTLAALFLRNQIKPIRRLARAAEAFGKGQNLDLYPRGASEVRSATTAFLSMRARIERQIEQRTMMLSGVSHDLRTPLTRLGLSVSLLDQGDETEMMERDLKEMQEILDEFLAFAQGDTDETVETVNPKTLVKKLVKNARRSGREVALEFEGQFEDVEMKMRRPAMKRALSNLISNALKYGDKIMVSVYLGAGFVEFSVEDDGPGISKDQRQNALKPFSRLDAARNQDKGSGVGLGLAIAADIARSHGGALSLASSEALGGLKASIRLPR